jgi:glycine/D-amino acid oxidase-like deaminating enzyme
MRHPPQEHCASYYAATLNERATYPALEGEHDADACVVGAGFTGVATALTLAERGYRVALLEAHRVGWGASGRNGGQLLSGIAGEARLRRLYGPEIDDLLWDLRRRGNEIVEDRVRRYGIRCDLKHGYVEVALKQRQVSGFEADRDEHARRGVGGEVRLVAAEELRSLLGTSRYIGGLLNEVNAHLHPLNLCAGEARAAAGLGALVHENSPVLRIQHGARPRVVCEHGSIRADNVVLAGGAYHALERARLGGLAFAASSFMIATEPLGEERVREINPRDLAVADANVVLDYFRLSADRRLLFGGRCNYSGRVPASISASLLPRLLEVYPQLNGVRIDYEWGGKMGIVINRIPLIGRIAPNVWYAQSYSGHGLNVSHVAGEILTDAIAGRMERFDVFARVRHVRLPVGEWAGRQLLALGMLYYRLRDLV